MQPSRLSAPIRINSLRLKNRMVMPAIHHAYTYNGHCTEQFREYYWRRAEGGLGLIIVGSCRLDGYGAKINSMSLASDDTVPGWKTFTSGMHERGCPVAVQLFHAGRYIPRRDVPCGGEALAPSAVYTPYTRETAPEMSIAQIETLLCDYAAAAARAKEAGFDAVEISGSSGYLLCQFLSPLTNLREDEYGGSFENRCRFPLEVIRAVRAAVGQDFPVIYRLSADDLVPGSSTLSDILRYVPLAEEAGVDCFDVTGGWHESRIPQLTGEVPRAAFSHFARSVKSVCSVPVILCNRVNTPASAELSLALGDADLVGVGRASVADPDFALKAVQGRAAEIRPCVACNQGCLASSFFDFSVECLANGLCGREHEFPTEKACEPKKVLVIGGGPAGCETAIRAAQRGHRVTLWDKGCRLGGQLNLVARLPGRGEFKSLVAYYKNMLSKLGVEVCLKKTAAPEGIRGFDKVFLANGGVPAIPQLPKAPSSVPVYSIEQVLTGAAVPGSDVVVIGGSFAGCETARYLSREASLCAETLMYMSVYELMPRDEVSRLLGSSRRNITILEKGPKLGLGYEPGTAWPVIQDLKRLDVKRVTDAMVLKIDESGVLARVKPGTDEELEEHFPCDSVVVASGTRPDFAFLERLKSAGVDATAVGSARVTGRCIDAVRDAARLGAAF